MDAVTNGIWAFMWFVCFCYTADQLRNNVIPLPTGAYNCAGAGIAFSFFCILIWVSVCVGGGEWYMYVGACMWVFLWVCAHMHVHAVMSIYWWCTFPEYIQLFYFLTVPHTGGHCRGEHHLLHLDHKALSYRGVWLYLIPWGPHWSAVPRKRGRDTTTVHPTRILAWIIWWEGPLATKF